MSINRSNKTVNEILSRAAADSGFRAWLLASPGAALAGYTLADADRAALSDPHAVRAALDDWEAPVV
jgi:hypothetical protein